MFWLHPGRWPRTGRISLLKETVSHFFCCSAAPAIKCWLKPPRCAGGGSKNALSSPSRCHPHSAWVFAVFCLTGSLCMHTHSLWDNSAPSAARSKDHCHAGGKKKANWNSPPFTKATSLNNTHTKSVNVQQDRSSSGSAAYNTLPAEEAMLWNLTVSTRKMNTFPIFPHLSGTSWFVSTTSSMGKLWQITSAPWCRERNRCSSWLATTASSLSHCTWQVGPASYTRYAVAAYLAERTRSLAPAAPSHVSFQGLTWFRWTPGVLTKHS